MERYLLLQNGTLIDGVRPEPIRNASVLIEGERITAVGGVDAVKPPSHGVGSVIDVSGRTIMPGMIDCHFHAAYHDVACWEDYDLRRSMEHTTILAARNAQTLLEIGFTSARSAGGRGLIDIALRDMIDQGALLGPRLKACGRILTTTGGLADGYGDWVENRAMLGIRVDGAQECLKAARQAVKFGQNVIKVEASGTGISPFSYSGKQTMTEEEIGTVVKEAHRNGVHVACHAQATEGIKTALRAGVDTVEHGSFLDDEGAALFKKTGAVLVPTISVLWLYVNKGPEVGVPPVVVEKFRGDLERHFASVRLALDTGIPMVVGSDSGHRFNPQSIIAIELEMMVQAGFTPMQAIQSATRLGADAIGMGHEVGRVAPGYFGDLLVLDGDPLADISIMQKAQRLERIYKGGALVAGRLAPRRREIELGYNLALEEPVIAGGACEADARPSCLEAAEELGL